MKMTTFTHWSLKTNETKEMEHECRNLKNFAGCSWHAFAIYSCAIYIYIYIHSCAHKFTYPLLNVQNVNNRDKIRGIMKILCYFLFSTVLNKLFHITYVYIYSTRQNNN